MPKIKKHRGHKRIWDAIEQWEQKSRILNMDWLLNQGRASVGVGMYPIENYSVLSEYREPRGKTRALMLEALLNVYEHWKIQLDSLDTPYYLKIWLYEPRFSESQVVCSIGSLLHFYNNTFFKPDIQKDFSFQNQGAAHNKLEEFTWEYVLDEVILSSNDEPVENYYDNNSKYKEQLKKYKSRISKSMVRKFTDSGINYYAIRYGNVWIGGK